MAPPLGNLFLLLDLDPAVDDLQAIQAAIDRKATFWGKAHDERSRLLLQRLHEIRAAMLDAEQRASYRSHAVAERARLATEAQGQLAALAETLALSLREGAAVLQAEVHKIAEAVRPLSVEQVREALQAAGVRCLESSARPDATRKVKFDRVQDLLALLAKRDLYDLLSLPPTATPVEVIARADAEYTRLNTKPPKNVERQVTHKLVGDIKTIFKSAEERLAYDQHLADTRLQPLGAHIEALGRRERCITGDQFDLLVARGVKLGADARAAERYILRYCDEQDLLVYERAGAARRGPPLRVYCGGCGGAALSHDDLHCRECGKGLRSNCPGCGGQMYAMDAACASCGLAVSDVQDCERQMTAAQRASTAGDGEAAAGLLRRLLTRWPQHEPAQKALAELTARSRQAAAAALEIESALNQQRLGSAERNLSQAIARFGPRPFDALRTRLLAAQGRLAEALRLGRDAVRRGLPAEAERHFLAALDLAVDHQEAQALLDAVPVDAPREFKAHRQGQQVLLQWQAGETGTRYRVMRRAGGPVFAEDATQLVELAEAGWIDHQPPRGQPIHYALAAVRRDRQSPLAAAGAVLVPDVPTQFIAVAGDRCVSLSWRAPHGATGVELRASPHGGTEQRWVLAANRHEHEGLVNGIAVDYVLAATYADPGGGVCRSAAVRATALPSKALEPVRELKVARNGETVIVHWTPPPEGSVEIRLLNAPMHHALGTRISAPQLAALGPALQLQALAPGMASVSLGGVQGESALFAAFTVDASSATVGACTALLMLEPVRDLDASLSGRHIVVRWTWPRLGKQVDVAWRHDRAPESPTDPQAIVKTVSWAEYAQSGAFRIASDEDRTHFISVWVRGSDAGTWSAGTTRRLALGAAAEVGYRVIRRPFSSRRAVELKGPTGTVLTNVEIYGREGGPPIGRQAGMLVARAATVTLAGGRAEIDVSGGTQGHYIKVFCDDPEMIRLSSLDNKGARL